MHRSAAYLRRRAAVRILFCGVVGGLAISFGIWFPWAVIPG